MIAPAEAMPTIDSIARSGRRDRLRSTIRAGCDNHRRPPSRSNRDTRKASGVAGRIASAGGSETTLRTAPSAPTVAAARLTPTAIRMPEIDTL